MNRTLDVIDPPATKALTTVERVMMESIIFAGADPQLIQAKILEASSDIGLRVEPTLFNETVIESFFRDPCEYWEEWLNLSIWPVKSIASVVVDGVEIDLGQVRIDIERRRLRRWTQPGYFGVPYGWGFSTSVQIAYTGGYLLPGEVGRDLPPALEGACIDLVSSYWHSRGRDPTLRAETNTGVYEFQYWTGAQGEQGSLPAIVEQKIYPFKCKPFVW